MQCMCGVESFALCKDCVVFFSSVYHRACFDITAETKYSNWHVPYCWLLSLFIWLVLPLINLWQFNSLMVTVRPLMSLWVFDAMVRNGLVGFGFGWWSLALLMMFCYSQVRRLSCLVIQYVRAWHGTLFQSHWLCDGDGWAEKVRVHGSSICVWPFAAELLCGSSGSTCLHISR